MSKVITFSRTFPSYHPRKGEPTYFVEKIWESIYLEGDNPRWLGENYTRMTNSIPLLKNIGLHTMFDPKHHTIRAGHRFKVGDWFSPRVWSGEPYNSKQIIIAPDIQVKKVWDFKTDGCDFFINGELAAYASSPSELFLSQLSVNDGLSEDDLLAWFQYPKEFDGQIICWNENIEY